MGKISREQGPSTGLPYKVTRAELGGPSLVGSNSETSAGNTEKNVDEQNQNPQQPAQTTESPLSQTQEETSDVDLTDTNGPEIEPDTVPEETSDVGETKSTKEKKSRRKSRVTNIDETDPDFDF